MRKNAKRIMTALLAAVMIFTDCVSGFAAEENLATAQNNEHEELNELEIMDRNQDVTLTESMQEEFSQEVVTEEETLQILFEEEELREASGKSYRLSDGTILAAQYGMDVHFENETAIRLILTLLQIRNAQVTLI